MTLLRRYRLGILVALLFASFYFADWSQDRYDFARTNGVTTPAPKIRFGVLSSSAVDLSGALRPSSPGFLSGLPYGTSVGDSGSAGFGSNQRLMNGFSSQRLSVGDAAFESQSGGSLGSSRDGISVPGSSSQTFAGSGSDGLNGTTSLYSNPKR